MESPSKVAFNRAEVAVSLLAAILLQLEVWLFDPGPPALGRALVSVVAAGALAFLRSYPFGAYLLNGVAVYALIAIGYPSDYYQWTNFIALVVMASRSPLGRSLAGLFLGFAGITFYFIRFPEEGDGLITAAFVMALYLAGWLVGRAQLGRSRLAAQEAQSELVEERTRLARELHDIVGHAVNLMVVQAGAGERIFDTDPAMARTTLKSIADTGRTALADLDRMLNLLAGGGSRQALPTLAQLDELCREFSRSGPPVDLTIEGDLQRVPASVSLAGYRLVQEALTNTLKHAAATKVAVNVVIDNDVTIRVTDNGRGGKPQIGRGLRGMVERAELHGGTVRFENDSDGGFVVESRIPLRSAS
ncbi:MAG TPA: sensor histidine kinase [Acidimicrobiia bacterium]|jgi:signal transduction histidine kinase